MGPTSGIVACLASAWRHVGPAPATPQAPIARAPIQVEPEPAMPPVETSPPAEAAPPATGEISPVVPQSAPSSFDLFCVANPSAPPLPRPQPQSTLRVIGEAKPARGRQ
jgi:hypothetical protein